MSVGRIHPSLWLFIRKLKDEQHLVELTLAAGVRGDPAPTKRRKWRLLETRIQRLNAEYNIGARTIHEFWHAVTYAVTTLI